MCAPWLSRTGGSCVFVCYLCFVAIHVFSFIAIAAVVSVSFAVYSIVCLFT